jgi:adenosylhomocysteinase
MLPATHEIIRQKLYPEFLKRPCKILVIQHLMPDTAAFASAMKVIGMPISHIIGIPYSTKNETISSLRESCDSVVLPQSLEEIVFAASMILEDWVASSEAILIHEVGGYLAELLRLNPQWSDHVVAVVEETKQGLWRYTDSVSRGSPMCVIQFADSDLKRMEAEFVGRAVARVVEDDLATLGAGFDGAVVGVVGVGDIGIGVAEALRRRGATVLTYDSSSARRIRCVASGFKVADLQTLLSTCDCIVGATGRGALKIEHLENARDGLLLVSASSRQLEFPVAELETEYVSVVVNAHITSYRRSNDRLINLSDRGYPVNFRTRSLSASFADLMFSQIALGMQIALLGQVGSGVRGFTAEEENIVSNIWWEHHGHVHGWMGLRA